MSPLNLTLDDYDSKRKSAEDVWDEIEQQKPVEEFRVCARCGFSDRNPHPYGGAYGFQTYLGKGKYANRTLCWTCRDKTFRGSKKDE